jgi:hypothetical protein
MIAIYVKDFDIHNLGFFELQINKKNYSLLFYQEISRKSKLAINKFIINLMFCNKRKAKKMVTKKKPRNFFWRKSGRLLLLFVHHSFHAIG